ncbi:TONSL [Symbiodinium necroappetens]|uniref:TONSL protein n=1 Tax=Symbiodinium necroappetens TaxID=1628268 RepID=A0A813C3I3_9DINO|nr:TONSL [Symbiodinium necroappetens]
MEPMTLASQLEPKEMMELQVCSLVSATKPTYTAPRCPLKELDISLNHIDYRAALVLEDLLSENRHLTVLDISFNPIGPVGMRSFVRLLLRERSGLHRVRFEGCAGGKHPVDDLQFMNANCPGARYSLQLDRPDHRSVLRMLYKSCDELKVNPGEAFFHVQFSEGAYKHPDVGADGIYAVPRKGRLQATFKIEKAIHQHLKVKEDDFLAFLRRRNDLMRLCPSDNKQILLLHAWRAVSDVDPDQGVFLDALARDVVLPFAVVERMCRSCLSPAEVVSRLFPALRACASERCLILMIARSIPDVTQILQHARPLMFFNIQNPTGHYRVDLSHPAEHSIAEALVVLDSWESAIRIRNRHVDTSQFGDWSQVRNITFRGSPLQGPLTEWLLPEAGKLELDYSSSARPPEGAQVLDDKSFRIMLIALQDQNFQKKGSPSGAGPDQAKLPRDDMQALRMVAHQIYITALQTRALTECFMDPCDREDCLITFFNRIADMHNEKVFSVRFEGDDEQVNRLRTRLGSLVFFPWVQPEQARFVFQLDRFDERTALCALINLAKKERMTNIQKPRWVRGDGSVDPLVMGLPRSWETISQIPEHGTVSMSYKCAPEDRNFKVRKSFLQTYGNWPCDVNMEQVLWWASTNEVPVDVMEFLEFIIERYDDVYEAFDDIKSKNAQVLNHRDFEEGLRRVKCKKFKGRREGDKITGIFRYLDPSGEGQVTRSEWGILELCHKEMVYSIQEFVHFCSRSFGNDLNAAWAVFDVNGDNFISEAEWVTVARSFSYFGPTLPIFRFLDRDDEGTISFEEFEELQKFREPPRPDVQSSALAAVVLEMFDERWQRMQRLHPGGSLLRSLLDNEMQAVAEAAGQGAVPVVFGDLSDEELDAVLKDVAIATLTDAGSVSGWANIWYDVVNCCTTLLSSPKRQEKELGVSSAVMLGSIVAPLLLLAMTPIAVIRNLLVLGMEAPFSITAGLLLMGLLIPAFTLLVPARPLDTDFADAVPLSTQPGWLNWVVLPSLALAILAVWRVQLRAILTDRDVHIAGCIADACNKYGGRQKVVLAVVGTLHLAGISRLVGTCEADHSM